MHDTTKQSLTDDLVAWGYVILLVDSYATRGIEHACASHQGEPHAQRIQAGASAFATFLRRTRDAYGALSSWLAKPSSIHNAWLRSALGRRMGGPVCCGAKFVRTVRPSQQLVVPGGGCVLPSMSAGSGASGDTHAHLYRDPRRLDAGGRLFQQSRRLGQRRAANRACSVSRRAPQFLLSALSARQDHVRSLARIQRRGSGQCTSPPAPVSRSPPQLKARDSGNRN